jgi:hypothetical protein
MNRQKEPEKLTYKIIADLIVEREETLLNNYKKQVIEEIKEFMYNNNELNDRSERMWDFFGMVRLGRYSVSLTWLISMIALITIIIASN